MRGVIRRFVDRIQEKVRELRPRRIVDLGCGEGIVASELSGLGLDFEYLGLDLYLPSVEAARRLNEGQPSLRFEVSDFLTRVPLEGWADLALCLEVIEHLPYPQEAVHRILQWTGQNAIISVPWEPWFRMGNLARGKYLNRLGNHPEHIQQFNPRKLRGLLQGWAGSIRIETCFPWIIATIVKE